MYNPLKASNRGASSSDRESMLKLVWIEKLDHSSPRRSSCPLAFYISMKTMWCMPLFLPLFGGGDNNHRLFHLMPQMLSSVEGPRRRWCPNKEVCCTESKARVRKGYDSFRASDKNILTLNSVTLPKEGLKLTEYLQFPRPNNAISRLLRSLDFWKTFNQMLGLRPEELREF